ncbi:disintegrin and metalloproteinase domain-containing protein 2-like [Eulemur rufifrons]|uniref:disintegrin and metalloproteinase domain-containing protein 2-like n=1 Tax=Eulemur rufifrons TaxID=859984 RepID=UPI003743D4B2
MKIQIKIKMQDLYGSTKMTKMREREKEREQTGTGTDMEELDGTLIHFWWEGLRESCSLCPARLRQTWGRGGRDLRVPERAAPSLAAGAVTVTLLQVGGQVGVTSRSNCSPAGQLPLPGGDRDVEPCCVSCFCWAGSAGSAGSGRARVSPDPPPPSPLRPFGSRDGSLGGPRARACGPAVIADRAPTQYSERLLVEITVPVKTHSVVREGIEVEVSYKIVIEGKTFILNLMQKTFLPYNFRVYGYNGTEIMKPLKEEFQNFCYYQGYIEDYPNSMVIISTCNGIRGLLQFENISYGIEPLESSVGFEHVIYHVKVKNADIALYTVKDIESRDLSYKIQSIEPQQELSPYIEMHIVVEKKLYDHMGSDTAVVTQKIFQLIGLTNAIFTSFNITVILSSLELWADKNKMLTTGDANELLHRFLKWKRSYLVLRPHDVAFLLTYREKSNYVGATYKGKMCDRNYGGGIVMHPRAISMESLSVIFAQLLSLSMGIAYDDTNKCQCSGAICIMNPEAIHFSGVKMFSNCSMEDFAHFISKQKSQCLQNQPRLDPSYKEAAVCGNEVVEAGEDCDCGSQESCANAPVQCCDGATCKYVAGSNCDEGPCCDDCHYKGKDQICRSAIDECDLPEYCNGSSAVCQEDLFVQNGHPCGENQWFCFDGLCSSGSKQCKDLFNHASDFGPDECFRELNTKTDQSGNCGSGPEGYTKCATKDLKCGKLICTYTSEKIITLQAATIIYLTIDEVRCVALEYPHDHTESANMWVKDGTVCDTNKVCKNKMCEDTAVMGYDCTAEKCSNHGKCNNKKHCHCDASFLPPNCATEDATWPGGSIDSGNFPPAAAAVHGRYIESVYHPKPTRWPFFLLIPFFIILCVLIAMLVKVRYQRKKWKTEDYTSDEQLESESLQNSTQDVDRKGKGQVGEEEGPAGTEFVGKSGQADGSVDHSGHGRRRGKAPASMGALPAAPWPWPWRGDCQSPCGTCLAAEREHEPPLLLFSAAICVLCGPLAPRAPRLLAADTGFLRRQAGDRSQLLCPLPPTARPLRSGARTELNVTRRIAPPVCQGLRNDSDSAAFSFPGD